MRPSNAVKAVIVSAVLVVAACTSSSSKAGGNASGSGAPRAGGGAAASGAAATPSTIAPATLTAVTNATLGKPILVDALGRTVYMYEPDGASPTSHVPADIKANWPAVTAASAPTAGSGLDATKLAVHAQADGTQQVSYNGHLLYTFVGDSAPGDAGGQNLAGTWFTLSPAGDKNA
jgi:predicted lipoprotein with Yx(FWY)xxD motif